MQMRCQDGQAERDEETLILQGNRTKFEKFVIQVFLKNKNKIGNNTENDIKNLYCKGYRNSKKVKYTSKFLEVSFGNEWIVR